MEKWPNALTCKLFGHFKVRTLWISIQTYVYSSIKEPVFRNSQFWSKMADNQLLFLTLVPYLRMFT